MSLTLFTNGTSLRWDIILLDSNFVQAKAGLKLAMTGLSECRKKATKLRANFLKEHIEAQPPWPTT